MSYLVEELLAVDNWQLVNHAPVISLYLTVFEQPKFDLNIFGGKHSWLGRKLGIDLRGVGERGINDIKTHCQTFSNN